MGALAGGELHGGVAPGGVGPPVLHSRIGGSPVDEAPVGVPFFN